MLQTIDPNDPKQVLRTVTILWAALTAGPVVAAGAFHAVVVMGSAPVAGLPPLVAYAAVGFAIASVAASFIVPPLAMRATAGAKPGSLFISRAILAAAIGESGALACCVAYLLTGERAALLGVAVFVAAQLSRKPSRDGLEAVERELRGTLR